jgi:hypothetical protein
MDATEPSDNRAALTTIAWRLAHLIDVFGPPTVPHFEAPRPTQPATYSATAEGALHQLDAGHDAWIHDVRNLGLTGLTRPQGALSPPAPRPLPVDRMTQRRPPGWRGRRRRLPGPYWLRVQGAVPSTFRSGRDAFRPIAVAIRLMVEVRLSASGPRMAF